MVYLTPPVAPTTNTATSPADHAVKAVARVLREKRDEAAALVRLVEQVVPMDHKGQNVNYHG